MFNKIRSIISPWNVTPPFSNQKSDLTQPLAAQKSDSTQPLAVQKSEDEITKSYAIQRTVFAILERDNFDIHEAAQIAVSIPNEITKSSTLQDIVYKVLERDSFDGREATQVANLIPNEVTRKCTLKSIDNAVLERAKHGTHEACRKEKSLQVQVTTLPSPSFSQAQEAARLINNHYTIKIHPKFKDLPLEELLQKQPMILFGESHISKLDRQQHAKIIETLWHPEAKLLVEGLVKFSQLGQAKYTNPEVVQARASWDIDYSDDSKEYVMGLQKSVMLVNEFFNVMHEGMQQDEIGNKCLMTSILLVALMGTTDKFLLKFNTGMTIDFTDDYKKVHYPNISYSLKGDNQKLSKLIFFYKAFSGLKQMIIKVNESESKKVSQKWKERNQSLCSHLCEVKVKKQQPFLIAGFNHVADREVLIYLKSQEHPYIVCRPKKIDSPQKVLTKKIKTNEQLENEVRRMFTEGLSNKQLYTAVPVLLEFIEQQQNKLLAEIQKECKDLKIEPTKKASTENKK